MFFLFLNEFTRRDLSPDLGNGFWRSQTESPRSAPDQPQIATTIRMWELLEDRGKPREAHGSRLHFCWTRRRVREPGALLCCPSLLSEPRLIVHLFTWSGPITAHSFSQNIYTHKLFSIWTRAILAEPQHEWAGSRFRCEKIIPCFLCILIRPLTCILFFYFPVLLLQIGAQTTWTAQTASFPCHIFCVWFYNA